MTPQTTFATPYNPWKANPTHRPRGWATEPEQAPVVTAVVKKPVRRNCWRAAVLEQIKARGSASCNDLIEAMGLPKHSINCALRGLLGEGKVRIKTVPVKNRRPSYLYFPRLDDAQS